MLVTPTRFLHLANHHSTNVGNGALIWGTERVVSEDLDVPTEFAREPWDDYTLLGARRFDEDFVSLVNRKVDALLVGGAVTLNGRTQFTNSGMRLDLPLGLWAEIRQPIIFYGISYRVWPGQAYANRERLQQTLDYLLENPRVLFGVRNDGSKVWLESLIGYASANIVPIPDPGLYVPAAEARRAEIDPDRLNLVLSLNNEDEVERFGGAPGWEQRRREFLSRLAEAVEGLVRRWDFRVILAPHYLDDYKIMAEFVPLCSAQLAHQVMISTGLARVSQTPYFYSLYAQADLALSMRVHSMSPSIGLGTPCIALTSQARMSEFLADAGLTDFGVDVFDPDLVEKVSWLGERCVTKRAEVTARFAVARRAMRARTATFNHRIADLLATEVR